MEPSAALLAGLVAGLAIAVQVGAVSLLLIEASIASGPRAGVAAGMGVATADFAFAVVAAAAGGAAGAALAGHERAIRIVAGATLAAIAVHGLIGLARSRVAGGDQPRSRGAAPRSHGAAPRSRGAEAPSPGARPSDRSHYARFLAITAVNPLTIASFAAVAAALSLDGVLAAAAFAAGVGLASGAWHAVLPLAAGHAGRWMTPRVRRGLAVGGRVAVLAIAAHLALGR